MHVCIQCGGGKITIYVDIECAMLTNNCPFKTRLFIATKKFVLVYIMIHAHQYMHFFVGIN